MVRPTLLALLVLACNAPSSPQPSPQATPKRPLGPVAAGESNVAREDYIGPEACGECHEPQLAAWSASLHRVMNARAGEPGAVIGDFSGVALELPGGQVVFARDAAGHATMTVHSAERAVRYRITRTIGKRGLQEYVGVQDGKLAEVRLPFGYWPRGGGWTAQPAFDPWLDDASFDPFAPVSEPWAQRCPWCHSTYPFAQRIARANARPVGHGFEQYFVAPAGGDVLELAAQVSTGISCESCHLGGRAHAAGAGIDFLPHGVPPREDAPRWPATFAEQRVDARVINTVCAQCHSGPSPRLPDGTALRNSSEALDLAASSCTTARCTDCHDPHAGGADESRAVAACVRCHATQRDPVHAGAAHAGATCLDCHMPRVVQGIDRYVRTHRIALPVDARVVAAGGPNACNLCHLDRSLGWTLAELREGWDVKHALDPDIYGRDEPSVGDVWLASESASVRLLAMHAYARSPLGAFARARLEQGLRDPQSHVRAWSRLALDVLDRR